MKSIWIKSYSSLKDSIKTRRVARRLNITVPQVIGHLHMLWWWVIEQAETGDISHVDAWEVEEVMSWDGEEGALFSALIEFGFIDDDGQTRSIHDWRVYSGAIFAHKEANREAQKRFRMKQEAAKKDKEHSGIMTEISHNNDVMITECLHNHATEESETALTPADGEATLRGVITAWNNILGTCGFPAVAKASPGRERAFNARINERAERRQLDWWHELFSRLAASKFMRDEAAKKSNWLCFDWILNETNLVKVCEGKYDDREKPAQRDKSYEEAAAEYYASL